MEVDCNPRNNLYVLVSPGNISILELIRGCSYMVKQAIRPGRLATKAKK
jgi:hypothetical protein